jgi:hypothetical protein
MGPLGARRNIYTGLLFQKQGKSFASKIPQKASADFLPLRLSLPANQKHFKGRWPRHCDQVELVVLCLGYQWHCQG